MSTSNPVKDFMEQQYPYTYEYLKSQSEHFMVTGEMTHLLNEWLKQNGHDWQIDGNDNMIKSLDKFELLIEGKINDHT